MPPNGKYDSPPCRCAPPRCDPPDAPPTHPAAEAAKGNELVAIGDKGRSQLIRAEPQLFSISIVDTYKVRVTFSQVRHGTID